MSDFILLFRATDAGRQAAMGTPERAQKSLQTWLNWIANLEAKGHLKERGHPLEPTGKLVDGRNGRKVITDGPYAEAKDILLGFIIVQAKDIEEAAQLSLACPMVDGGGSVEVRPVGSLDV